LKIWDKGKKLEQENERGFLQKGKIKKPEVRKGKNT